MIVPVVLMILGCKKKSQKVSQKGPEKKVNMCTIDAY